MEKNLFTAETEAARVWDSERRDSPFSTVADIEDESCECGGEFIFNRDTCATTCDKCGTELD